MSGAAGSATDRKWPFVARQVFAGRSVGRALMHFHIRSDVLLQGTVVDVGGGSRQTYLPFLDLSATKHFVVVDVRAGPTVDVVGSVARLPLRAACLDGVLCFNVLEHVFAHRDAFREIASAMKADAVFYGWVPFLIGVHGDPDDYYRYTGNALRILLSESGLEPVRVVNSGDAFLSAVDLVRPYLVGRIVGRAARVAAFALALAARGVFRRLRWVAAYKALDPDSSPCGIWIVAKRKRNLPC